MYFPRFQVNAYGEIAEKNSYGHVPHTGRVCLAKSTEDDQWYRAVALGEAEVDDIFLIFFADFGFTVGQMN